MSINRIHYFNEPVNITESGIGNYYVNVYKENEFVIGMQFENYSGMAVQEELSYLRRNKYDPQFGYKIEW